MLAGQGIHDAGGQLFHVGAVDALADLLDQHGIGLADVEHKVLLLVREQAADHIISRDVAAGSHAHDEHHAGNVGGKVQLAGLGVDIAGQDVVQHHVLDEVGLVELFVMILLDALQADGQHGGKLAGRLVGTFHEHRVIVVLCAGELLVGVAIAHKAVPCGQALRHKAVAHFPDQVQFRAGNDSAGLIHHADHPVDRIFHLVDHALKYSIGHTGYPFSSFVQTAAAATVIFTNFAALQSIFYTKEFTFATYFNKKDNSFLLKLSFGAFAGQKSAFLRGSWHYFSFKM